MPTKPNKRRGVRESTGKRIQNNDSKYDPKSWKQNGVTYRLETRIEKMQEMLNKDLEEIKKSQSIMNNEITEMKNILEGTRSWVTEAEDRISEVEDRMVEINEAERKKKKRIKRNEDNFRDLWDNVKCPNIRIIGVPEEKDKKKGHEKILEKIII